MVYLGRVVGIGITESGRSFVVYGVSGRSEASRQRKAVPYRTRVAIEPLGQPTEEQRQQAALLTYNAIKVFNGVTSEFYYWPYAIVSNGRHTNSLDHVCSQRSSDDTDGFRKALKRWGPEPDRYNTPRIMAVKSLCGVSDIGLITQPNKPRIITVLDDREPRGKTLTISTYSGDTTEPEASRFSRVRDIIRKVPLRGDTAQELAESFFEWMDPQFVVSTASAVWVDEKERWQLAVRNLYS